MCVLQKKKASFSLEISKGQGRKGIPSHFIWSKNADAVVKEYRRKSGGKSHSLDVVHGEIFVVSQQRYRSNFQFWLLLPKCFPLASLTLAFYRAHILWLTLVLKTFNWPDTEGANDTYGNTVHHYLGSLCVSVCVRGCTNWGITFNNFKSPLYCSVGYMSAYKK